MFNKRKNNNDISNIQINWEHYELNATNAHDFAEKYINKEPFKRNANNSYTSNYYLAHYGEQINNRLRQKRCIKSDLDCIETVAQHSNSEDIVLYTGICNNVYLQFLKEASKLNEPNVDLYNLGFTYCSLVKGHETNTDIHLKIFVPKGTQCVYNGNVNDEAYYFEVVLQAGMKFKILNIGKKYIECLIIS